MPTDVNRVLPRHDLRQRTCCLPTYRCAPRLPAVTYIVGRGGKLNPGGVFVVERPGLGDFLHRLAAFAEVRRAWRCLGAGVT